MTTYRSEADFDERFGRAVGAGRHAVDRQLPRLPGREARRPLRSGDTYRVARRRHGPPRHRRATGAASRRRSRPLAAGGRRARPASGSRTTSCTGRARCGRSWTRRVAAGVDADVPRAPLDQGPRRVPGRMGPAGGDPAARRSRGAGAGPPPTHAYAKRVARPGEPTGHPRLMPRSITGRVGGAPSRAGPIRVGLRSGPGRALRARRPCGTARGVARRGRSGRSASGVGLGVGFGVGRGRRPRRGPAARVGAVARPRSPALRAAGRCLHLVIRDRVRPRRREERRGKLADGVDVRDLDRAADVEAGPRPADG